jgi:hypothetical protein
MIRGTFCDRAAVSLAALACPSSASASFSEQQRRREARGGDFTKVSPIAPGLFMSRAKWV